MLIRSVIIAMIAGTGLILPVAVQADYAKDLRRAQSLLTDRKYDAAYAEYRRHAVEKKNPLASFTVALFHHYGWGKVVANPVTACEWHERAAKGGIPASAQSHAHCLLKGTRGQSDPKQAAVWFRRAADSGIFVSHCELGDLYLSGRGVVKDTAKGIALCEQSAQRGAPGAMLRLGRHYLANAEKSAKPDYTNAIRWLRRASDNRSPVAPYLLGTMARDGKGAGASAATAVTWFEIAGSRGYIPAYSEAGRLYFETRMDPKSGKTAPARLAKAYLWLSAAMARTPGAEKKAAVTELLAAVRKEMPESWIGDLDRKVSEHLKAFTPKGY